MAGSPPSHRPLPDAATAPVVGSTPSHYEVDPRGHRVEGRAVSAPGAGLVRMASILDLAALAGLVAHLATSVDLPIVLLLAGLSAPMVPLVVLYVSCASGMEDMTLRVRRIVGVVIPGMVFGASAARGRMGELLAASSAVLIPLITMPFGAYAAHRALRLAARARERASEAWRTARGPGREAGIEALERGGADAAHEPPSAGSRPTPARRRTAMGAVVLLSGFVLVACGLIEAMHRVWWFGLVWMAMGGLCIALSRDLGAPSSDRRLRRGDRGNPVVWVLAPVGALVAVARAVWILTVGS